MKKYGQIICRVLLILGAIGGLLSTNFTDGTAEGAIWGARPEYDPATGTVYLRQPGTVLQNAVVQGSVVITSEVDESVIILDNVVIYGTLTIQSGSGAVVVLHQVRVASVEIDAPPAAEDNNLPIYLEVYDCQIEQIALHHNLVFSGETETIVLTSEAALIVVEGFVVSAYVNDGDAANFIAAEEGGVIGVVHVGGNSSLEAIYVAAEGGVALVNLQGATGRVIAEGILEQLFMTETGYADWIILGESTYCSDMVLNGEVMYLYTASPIAIQGSGAIAELEVDCQGVSLAPTIVIDHEAISAPPGIVIDIGEAVWRP